MDECHMEQEKSVLKYMSSISCTAIATEVRISPAGVSSIITNSLGKQNVCTKWFSHVLNDDQRTMHSLIAF
jgi:hypothetical protein